MTTPKPSLHLDVNQFLSHHWQKKPLLIKAAIANFSPPILAEELAGLAMESEVESRIIETCDSNWQLHHGPFDEQDFNRDMPWTLLVQAVDHFVPEVAKLRQLLDFIPSWRIDDIMVSYASDGGSVGPHYDNYDVFLLQGEGQRRWQLGQLCDHHSALLDNPDLRILEAFECNQEYLLSTGDILYIPPGIAHWGVALNDCTTFSLGFRAPRVNDMLSRQTDEILETIDSELFYTDANIPTGRLSGEICEADLERAREQITKATSTHQSSQWFGELVTEPRCSQDIDQNQLLEYRALLAAGPSSIRVSASAKLAWRHCEAFLEIYANGITLKCELEALDMVITLCQGSHLAGTVLSGGLNNPPHRELLEELLDRNCLIVE